MTPATIAHRRLLHQRIARPDIARPGLDQADQVVQWMGAMQAQEYGQVLWAVALRTPATTQSDVQRAIAEGRIVQTWLLRGTLHLVAAADLRWLLDLCAPRTLAAAAPRLKQLELDGQTLDRARHLFQTALGGGQCLTRTALLGRLERAGINPAGQRGHHILWFLAQTGLICFGPRQDKEQTFVLLEDWVVHAPVESRDDSLAELANRYFTSHGPATVHDFAVWSGLTLRDARAGLASAQRELAQGESAQGQLISETRGLREYWWSECAGSGAEETPTAQQGGVHLLPGFDEYLLGYKDRRDVISAEHAARIVPGGNGVFRPMIVMDGQVVGRWKRTVRPKGVQVILEPFTRISDLENRVQKPVQSYCTFVNQPLLSLKMI